MEMMMMFMMLMMMVSVSPGPLPPSLGSFSQEGNTTDSLLHHVTENSTRNHSIMPVYTFSLGCPLPTCHIINLGSDLQKGDEKAGDSTKNPLGPGKK
ncbi:uncharacterized protein zgc:193726 isoform X1 [Notolabrus celidotus]|uniref:uncharacterized protein zgc:193726 isoform X1 n=1 Tax=Notolabrus celidotus TaxID=1203425 RepID=UPI00149063AC|nr:uncharacterized protein zgc:193726 isoform X1 [Notolabrus celidotus]